MNATSWITPSLVVLTRSRLEENVLAACKANAVGGGPEANNNGCGWIGANCRSCQPRSGGAS